MAVEGQVERDAAALSGEILEQVPPQVGAGADPVEEQLAGDPGVQRIVLIDAPAVLGWTRWREVEEDHALGLVKGALEAVAATGRLRPDLVDMLAHVLLAGVNEVALMVATADDTRSAQRSGEAAVDELLTRLLG